MPERSADIDGSDREAEMPGGTGAATSFTSDANIDQAESSASSTAPPDPSEDEETIVSDAAPRLEVIGDFEIHDTLGKGGMGSVYRARQISLDRWVALKILPASLEDDDIFVTRFQREARIAASLSHRNLVRVFSSGQADGCHYIAMELVEGETLGRWLKRGALPPPEALRICLDVARALEFGWQNAQLIHRDIKPGNIFLSHEGEVKVGDLGLAKSMSSDTTGLTHTGTAMGTPHYISPEQARGDKDLDFRADIYSLGSTLYQMLTGRTPYEGRDPLSVMHQHIHAPTPAILKVLPQCPIPLARLVGKMLKKIKRERHTSYGELIAQIEAVQGIFAPAESPLESALPPDPDGVLPETPGAFATPRSATPVTAPFVRPAATVSTKKKSSVPLYAGLGIAALVIGAAVLFLASGKDASPKESSATTRQSATAEAAANAPSADEAKAAANTGAEPWQDMLRDDGRSLNLKPGARIMPEGLALGKNSQAAVRATATRGQRDGAVRARFTFNGAKPQLSARSNSNGAYTFWVKNEKSLSLLRYDKATSGNTALREFSLPEPLIQGAPYEFELRIVGSTLTVKFQGAVVGSVEDATFAAGSFEFANYSGNPFEALLQSIEFLDLDAPTADGEKAVANAGAEPWQDLLLDDGRSLNLKPGTRITPEGLRLDKRTSAAVRQTKLRDQRDGALRTRFTFDGARPLLLARANDNGSYNLEVKDKETLTLFHNDTVKSVSLKEYVLPSPLTEGESYEMELRVDGSTLTAKFQGAVLGSVKDTTISAGAFGFANYAVDTYQVLLKSVEFLDLDASTETSTAGVPTPNNTTEPWQNMFDAPERLALPEDVQITADGLSFSKPGSASVHPKILGADRDGAVRVRQTYEEPRPQIQVTVRSNSSGTYLLAVRDASTLVIKRWDNATQQPTQLKAFTVSPPFVAGRSFEVELRVVGQTLTAKLDGVVLGSVDDSTYAQGTFGINAFGTPAMASAVSYLDLDASKPIGPWKNLLTDELQKERGAELTAEGLKMPRNSHVHTRFPAAVQDGAIRMKTVFDGTRVLLHARSSIDASYNLYVNSDGKTAVLTRWDKAGNKTSYLRTFTLAEPLKTGSVCELELHAVGPEFTAKLSGTTLGTVTDSTYSDGQFGVKRFYGDAVGAEVASVTSLEFLEL